MLLLLCLGLACSSAGLVAADTANRTFLGQEFGDGGFTVAPAATTAEWGTQRDDEEAGNGTEDGNGTEADSNSTSPVSRPPRDGGSFAYHPEPFADIYRDGATIILATLTLVIAASGGIGGGGILVPLYMLVLKFHPKHAIALSNFTILGGAIANTAANVRRRHPHADRGIIDWDLILIMEPLTIFGAVFGSLISKVLPNLILNVLLVMVLMWTGHRTFVKGVRMWQEESRRSGTQSPEEVAEPPPSSSSTVFQRTEGPPAGSMRLLNQEEDHEPVTPPMTASLSRQSRQSRLSRPDPGIPEPAPEPSGPIDFPLQASPREGPEEEEAAWGFESPRGVYVKMNSFIERDLNEEALQELATPEQWTRNKSGSISPDDSVSGLVAVDGEARTVAPHRGNHPKKPQTSTRCKVITLAMCLSGTCVLTVMRGSFRCGSAVFWVLYFCSLPWVLLFALYYRHMLIAEYEYKVSVGHIFAKGEVAWSPRNTIRYPVICALSGVVAGMFGVGGGIVKGPLMLEMGVIPSVASASAAAMVLFTSAAASTSFIVFGLLHYAYGLVFFLLGLTSTTVGQYSVNRWLKKHDRQSPTVLSIGLVIILSALLVGVNTFALLSGGERKALVRGHGVCTEDTA